MKIEIRFDVGFGILPGAIHGGNGLAHGRQFRFLDANCGKRGNLRLENGAHFRQMSRAFRLTDLHHQIERLAHGLRGAIGDESAAAGIGFDQTFFAQSFHRFAHGGAAHAKTLRQFALRGQLISRLQIAFDDGFFNLLNDLLVEPRRPN